MTLQIVTRPVGPNDVADLGRLFDSQRNPRRCWCMAFCTSSSQFALGWLGGNRRRFEGMTAASATPMGVLASEQDEPVGWCACGPRTRYVAATSPRNPIMRDRAPAEDETVWLLPCIFVHARARGQGVSHALLRTAVDLARRGGAPAIEGWPLAASVGRTGNAFVGREQVFGELGFRPVTRPAADRVVMRLDLRPT